MLEPVGLDAAVRREHSNLVQVRVFGGDAAEIVPHPGDDALDTGLGKLGESSGNARRRLIRARFEMPRNGPIRRATAPPSPDAHSIGNRPKAPNNSAAPRASSRSASGWWSAGVTAPIASIAVRQ